MTPFLVLLFLSSIVINSTAEGLKSVEDDLEIERQLKILSKPYIKSIKVLKCVVLSLQTAEGDIFDCVDIYKQPAFDHPLLKNHSIQLKPSFFPNFFPKRVEDKTLPHAAKTSAVGLSEGCPFGTVPIKRTRKEDLLWAKTFVKNSGSNIASPPAHFKRYVGYVLDEVSRYEGKQFSVKFHIVKDVREGNWWLVHDKFDMPLGYWPKSLFSSLSISATEVRWGYSKAAFIDDLEFADESNNWIYPDYNSLQYEADVLKCYTINATFESDYGHLFGGPGGNCQL
ncbi:hypothetical protein I3842_11G132200 [Carya illinoinensis]|uniref:Neprosin domain-containing protein n=1 Tax=Carya illinoinensis TaxID=32201 RepID=A0A922DPW9_CARIL|nr:hypothetical protein I3842_11G132200 [Carya illinoinensis]